MGSELYFFQMPKLRANARLRISQNVLYLTQRAPLAVYHQVPDPVHLALKPAVIFRPVKERAERRGSGLDMRVHFPDPKSGKLFSWSS